MRVNFLTVLFIAVALSMDSFAVSVSIGCILKEIRIKSAVKIACFYGVFQGVMPAAGWFAASRFRELINLYDHWAAFVLLSIIGSKMIYESCTRDEHKEKSDPLNNWSLTLMALATSIDAFAVGAGFAFFEVNILSSSILIAITTFVFSFTGVIIGCKTGSILKNKAELTGGIILIAIGVKIAAENFI